CDRNLLQIQSAVKGRCSRLVSHQGTSGPLQSHLLIARAGKAGCCIQVKWSIGREIRQRNVYVVIDGTRLLVLQIGQSNLSITDFQSAERKLLLTGGWRLRWRARGRRDCRRFLRRTARLRRCWRWLGRSGLTLPDGCEIPDTLRVLD